MIYLMILLMTDTTLSQALSEDNKIYREHLHHVDKKLVFRVRMFSAISLITFGISIVETIYYGLEWWYLGLGLALGIAVGWGVSYAQKVSRDTEKLKIITRMDVTGIIILVAYVAFAIARRWLFSYVAQDAALTVLTLSFTTGTMWTRGLVLYQGIINLIKDLKLPKMRKKEKSHKKQ